jgi:predicted transcriptional regulator
VKNRREDVEEVIIQGLAHKERRNILKIISLAENGAVYSDILGELGLNTGRMNYHLKQLEGLVERNGDRRYRLTPLGKKALGVLHSMTEGLDDRYERYLNSATSTRDSGLITWANRWFYLFTTLTFTALLGVFAFVYYGVGAGELPETSYYYIVGLSIVVIVFLIWFKGWVRREAENLQEGLFGFLDRILRRHR